MSRPQTAKRAPARDLWIQIHRYVGLVAAAFLLVAAITGCILCFDHGLDRALNRDLLVRADAAAPLDALAAEKAFAAAHPQLQVTGFPLNPAPDDALRVQVVATPGAAPPKQSELFLDADGRVVGGRDGAPGWGRRGFVQGVEKLHFNLLVGDWGRWLMGVVALTWLFSNFVGIYLTWPRRAPYLRSWWKVWRFSFRSPLPKLLLDLHRATGLWLIAGLSVLAFTSVCLNFYSEAYEPVVLRISPLKHTLFDRPAPYPDGARPTLQFADAVRLAAKHAAEQRLEARPATALYMPSWNLYGVTFTRSGQLDYRGLGPVYYYFDARDGHFVHVVDPYSDSAGLVMIRMLYPLHSGQVAGWPTVLIIFLLGLATIEQGVTGVWVWWKKRRVRKAGEAARRRATAAAALGEAA